MEPCSRHIEIVEQIDELEDRVKYLELSDTETKTELKNLIKQVEKLVATIEVFMACTRNTVLGVAGTSIMVLVGFFVWYIQKL